MAKAKDKKKNKAKQSGKKKSLDKKLSGKKGSRKQEKPRKSADKKHSGKKPAAVVSVAPPAPRAAYSDGHPMDEVQYLEAKLILKPDGFTSVQSFREFGALMARTAAKEKVGFIADPAAGLRPHVREIIFGDTFDFRLYNNAFILRRRIDYVDGFPVGDPEIVFKFRHPDLEKAAEVDVRPVIDGKYRIKFKAEALPLKDQLGGYRILYSHNCQFGLSQVRETDRRSMKILTKVFPPLGVLQTQEGESIDLVNQAIVEEVLLDLGQLDFGHGIVGKTDVALWRTRGEHKPLVGEYAFQVKFENRNVVHAKAKERCEQFFIRLQYAAKDWISLGTTKTGMVYRLNGNQPQSHE